MLGHLTHHAVEHHMGGGVISISVQGGDYRGTIPGYGQCRTGPIDPADLQYSIGIAEGSHPKNDTRLQTVTAEKKFQSAPSCSLSFSVFTFTLTRTAQLDKLRWL